MEIKIKKKTIGIILGLIVIILLSCVAYQLFKPITTIFIKGVPFSFRRDIRRALNVEVSPREEILYDLFTDYKIRNVTIVFKPGTPETNAFYQLETFEIVYKLSRYDDLTGGIFRPPKYFNAQQVDTYDNILRDDNTLKIILVPPEFSNETRVSAGGNRIWIYGETEKDFDFAVMKAILSVMNVTSLEGFA